MAVRSAGIILAITGAAASAAFAQVKQEQPISALKGHNSNAPVIARMMPAERTAII